MSAPAVSSGLIPSPVQRQRRAPADDAQGGPRGFGGPRPGGQPASGRGKRRRGSGYGSSDRLPLGKHPEHEAVVARQRLCLPLSGRLRAEEVNRAWKRAAAEHHPDRGGAVARMQALNGARDLLLGRDLT
jgi:hypothetical protein